jgi:hypothetical protein
MPQSVGSAGTLLFIAMMNYTNILIKASANMFWLKRTAFIRKSAENHHAVFLGLPKSSHAKSVHGFQENVQGL